MPTDDAGAAADLIVRPFRRPDRDQVTDLVNAHVSAVVPNVTVSVQSVLGQLEHEPGEYIVGPWVAERRALVVEWHERILAAAHLVRYGAHEGVGPAYRATADLRWFLFWPRPLRPPTAGPARSGPAVAAQAADVLLAACLEQAAAWGSRQLGADAGLPAPAVYGLPEQWPHVRDALLRAGFERGERTESVYLAPVVALPEPGSAPLPGVRAARRVGVNGTRIAALRASNTGEEEVGCIEVDTTLDAGGRRSAVGGWADIGNLYVAEDWRRRGLGSWLVGEAARWLRLGGVDRLLAYADPADPDDAGTVELLEHTGFELLTRTDRGWSRDLTRA
jgi:GNAT superfamily N-acetyltransferase